MSDTTTLEQADAKAEPCYRLIYRSRSLLPEGQEGEAELAEILKVARQNNQKQGVTGALILYQEKGRFAQVLEGPEDTVKALISQHQEGPAPRQRRNPRGWRRASAVVQEMGHGAGARTP